MSTHNIPFSIYHVTDLYIFTCDSYGNFFADVIGFQFLCKRSSDDLCRVGSARCPALFAIANVVPLHSVFHYHLPLS